MAINRLNKDKVPVGGSTDTRPSSAAIGDTHYNGTLGRLEIYTAQGWMALNAPAATPTGVTATNAGSGRAYNNGSASVAFTPATTGGLPTSYVVTSSPGSYTATGSSSPIIVSGQQSNTSYTYTVMASNDFGTATSSASAAVTATTIPQPPTIGAVTGGNTVATVAYTANGTGGLSNTYTATSSPGGFTGTGSSPITVSGLSNGTAYTFTVTATNANGTSAASAASSSVTPSAALIVDYLVVAGAGGGGGFGGGGGAGGLRSTVTASGGSPGTVESALTLSLSTNYTVTVGAGGAGGNGTTYTLGVSGNNSVFSSITSTGGGGGGAQGQAPLIGGSGGGASATGSTQTGAVGTANQGFAGGNATSGAPYGSGGGGGAGAVGINVDGNGGGGAGVATSITGTSTTYATGGGSGGYNASGSGGANGAANTGNGGQGVGNVGGSGTGNAGSGIVILRYPTNAGTITIGAGLTGTTATDGSHKVTTLTAGTGNVSWA